MDDGTHPFPMLSKRGSQQSRQTSRIWEDDLPTRALFEQIGECVFIIGMDFRYLAANQQALSLLNKSR